MHRSVPTLDAPPRALTDRRRYERRRIPVPTDVTPVARDAETLRTHSVDLSLDGVLLACVGLEGHVRLALQGPGGGAKVHLTGKVVRTEPGRTAVQFSGVGDQERTALKRLLKVERPRTAA